MVRAAAVVITVLAATATDAATIKHRFMVVDNGANKLIFVDEVNPHRGWVSSVPRGSRDMQIVGRDRLLVSHGNGASEYDVRTGKRLSWVVDRYRGIQSAVRLADGRTLLMTSRGNVYVLDATGSETGKFNIKVDRPNFRLLRTTRNGKLVIGAASPRAVLVAAMDGTVEQRRALPGKGYKAELDPDGRAFAGTGDDCRVVCLNARGKVTCAVGGKAEHPDVGLDFCSGWHRMQSGNIIMANWLGHGKHGKGDHLVEFTPQNKIVWKWADHKMARQVTNVLVLE